MSLLPISAPTAAMVAAASSTATPSAQHQQGLEQMDRRRRDRRAQAASEAPEDIVGNLQRPKFGVERYLDEQLNQAGGRVLSGSDRKAGAVFQSGRFKGMTRDQAAEKLRAEYAAMPDADRRGYEASASNLDVTSDREQSALGDHHRALATANGLPGPSSAGARIPGAASGVEPGTGADSSSGGGASEPIAGLTAPRLSGMARNPSSAAARPQGLDYLRPRSEVAARASAARQDTALKGKPLATASPTKEKTSPHPLASVLQTVGGGAGDGSRF